GRRNRRLCRLGNASACPRLGYARKSTIDPPASANRLVFLTNRDRAVAGALQWNCHESRLLRLRTCFSCATVSTQKALLDHEFSSWSASRSAMRSVAVAQWCVAVKPQFESIALVRSACCVPQEGAPGLVKFR